MLQLRWIYLFKPKKMALTSFKIELSRAEYDLINCVISYAVASLNVVDLASLFEKEILEGFQGRFGLKKFKLQKKFCFSFNAVELVIFIKHIGGMMEQMGAYEGTVYRLLYETQLVTQISRAVQLRIYFNS